MATGPRWILRGSLRVIEGVSGIYLSGRDAVNDCDVLLGYLGDGVEDDFLSVDPGLEETVLAAVYDFKLT